MKGGCPGNANTVEREEDELTSKMTDKQRKETEKHEVMLGKPRDFSRKDRQGQSSLQWINMVKPRAVP